MRVADLEGISRSNADALVWRTTGALLAQEVSAPVGHVLQVLDVGLGTVEIEPAAAGMRDLLRANLQPLLDLLDPLAALFERVVVEGVELARGVAPDFPGASAPVCSKIGTIGLAGGRRMPLEMTEVFGGRRIGGQEIYIGGYRLNDDDGTVDGCDVAVRGICLDRL